MAIALSLLASAAAPPTLPTDFYTGVQGLIVTAQGNYEKGDAMCCAKDSAGCLVSTQAKGWDIVQQGSRNRSLHRGGGGVTLTWAEPVRKVMLLQPGSAVNSTHKWACNLYCPFTDNLDTTETTIAPEHEKVTGLGTRIVEQPAAAGGATKSCDGFMWTQSILHLLKVTINTMWVDSSSTPPVPFKSSSSFTPEIAKLSGQANSTMNKSFVGFDASFDVAHELDVDMASVHACKKNKDQCPSTASYAAQFDPWRAMPRSLAAMAAAQFGAMSGAERAATEARHRADALHLKRSAVAAAADGHSPTRVQPVFSPSYTAHKQYTNRMAQGNTVATNGDSCCTKEAPACAVQMQQESATEYQDTEGQRVRTEYADGKVVVDDFNTNRTMEVAMRDGTETCVSYCPIPPIFPKLTGFTLPNGTVDKGSAVLDGQKVELFEWSETILKVITMSSTRFYAKVSANGSAVPVFESEALTPFGAMAIGTQNVTWKSFVPGRPPAAKFAIAGTAACPLAKHCQTIPAFQRHRRLSGQVRAWEEPIFGVPEINLS